MNKEAAQAKLAARQSALECQTVAPHPWITVKSVPAPDVTGEAKERGRDENGVPKDSRKRIRDEARLACEPHHWKDNEMNGEAAVVPEFGKQPKQVELSPKQAEVLAAINKGDPYA